ncbi:MAG: hypothetical protein Q6365_007965 [Candidatus Sigynarchaeota archaeon]
MARREHTPTSDNLDVHHFIAHVFKIFLARSATIFSSAVATKNVSWFASK